QSVIYVVLSVYALLCMLPMALVLTISFSSEASIRRQGYSFFPDEWSLAAYDLLFAGTASMLRSYGVSVFITGLGTLLAVTVTAMAAYALANPAVKYRN